MRCQISLQDTAGHRAEHYETRRRRKDGKIIDGAHRLTSSRWAGQIVGRQNSPRYYRPETPIRARTGAAREQEARRPLSCSIRSPPAGGATDIHKLVQEVTDIATALVGARLVRSSTTLSTEGEPSMLYSPARPWRRLTDFDASQHRFFWSRVPG
jgi:hypothetical protein